MKTIRWPSKERDGWLLDMPLPFVRFMSTLFTDIAI
jgi:hypothetical protein